MNELSYRGIPHKTIEAKAIRFFGNTYREALQTAKRKGAIGEPILTISKGAVCIIHYPSAELHEMALANQAQKIAEQAAIKAERERPHVLNNVRNLIAEKIKTQKAFERPNYF